MSDWSVRLGYGSKPTSTMGSKTILTWLVESLVGKKHRSSIGGDNDYGKAEGKAA